MCNSRLFDICGITWTVAVIITRDISQWFEMQANVDRKKEREREKYQCAIARLNLCSLLVRERLTCIYTRLCTDRALPRQHAPVTSCCRFAAAWLHATARATYFQLPLGSACRSVALLFLARRPGSRTSSMGRDWSIVIFRSRDRSPPRDPGRVEKRDNRIE